MIPITKMVASWESKYINNPMMVIATAMQLSTVLANIYAPYFYILLSIEVFKTSQKPLYNSRNESV